MKNKINIGTMLIVAGFLMSVSLLSISGCGSSADPLLCTGTSCDCPTGDTCDITDTACGGDSCTLACIDGNTCTGECGASCSADCAGDSSCDLTVGTSGSVTCADTSVCNVTCTDTCSLSCADTATCTLLCPGDTTPQDISSDGSCP